MILLDTNALVFDALAPARLTMAAKQAIQEDEASKSLACCDISLWEIAMLVGKDRIRVETDVASFLRYTLTARGIRVLAITPEIAAVSQSGLLREGDPADRLITATASHYRARLVTSDRSLHRVKDLLTVW